MADTTIDDEPDPYKEGVCYGWEAANNFMAAYMQELMKAFFAYPSHPALIGLTCMALLEYVIDDMDRHLFKLERWRDDKDASNETPPTPSRSIHL